MDRGRDGLRDQKGVSVMRLKTIRGKDKTIVEIQGVLEFHDGTTREVSASPESDEMAEAKELASRAFNKIYFIGLNLRSLRSYAGYVRDKIDELKRDDLAEVRKDPIIKSALSEFRRTSSELLDIARLIEEADDGPLPPTAYEQFVERRPAKPQPGKRVLRRPTK